MTSDISGLILRLLVVFLSFQVFFNFVSADVVCDIIYINYFRDLLLFGLCPHILGSPEWSCIPSVNFGMSNTSSLFNRHLSHQIQESFHLDFCLRLSLSLDTGASTILPSTYPSPFLLTCPYHFSLFV